MSKFIPLLFFMITGCTSIPKYSYQSQIGADPVFVFGDRFGGGSVNSPARSFGINTKDAIANKCSDFEDVGTTSNHWMHLKSRTIEIKTPAGKAVAVRGSYLYSSGTLITTCAPSPLMFIPKEGASYSVDVEMVNRKCQLSIVQKLPNGQEEKVAGLAILSACNNQ